MTGSPEMSPGVRTEHRVRGNLRNGGEWGPQRDEVRGLQRGETPIFNNPRGVLGTEGPSREAEERKKSPGRTVQLGMQEPH